MNYYRERILWKVCLTAATMPSEIILTIGSYVIASVLAVQMVRVSSDRASEKPGYEHPTIMAGGQMLFGLWDAHSWAAVMSYTVSGPWCGL